MKRLASAGFLAEGLLGMLCAVAVIGAADEVILRDGKKLSGTITGVERDVYRLETDFGVALIKKDRIARIELGPLEEKGTAAEKSAPQPARASLAPASIRERRPPGGRMEERVEGNTYVNESFRFEMFKPPPWRVFEHAAQNIPSAVAVLGTSDETTLLVVGSVVYEAPPAAYAKVLDSALRQTYSEFVAQPEEQIRVAGRTAIRRLFRGMAAGHEWHGMVVNLADGAVHYGIIGVTRDEAFQFKEGVLAKMVSSFRFR